MLFHFFNKKTTISDTYIQDPVSLLKLYPKKSNNLVTTSVSTQFHVAKELVDHTLGFTIEIGVYYDPATLSMSNYNFICGRGNNTGFPSGMFLPGVAITSFFSGKWKEGTSSQISKTGLTADWYRYSMTVTATTVQIKLLNLRTGIELSGNVASVGTSTVGEDKNFTFLCYGIDGLTGAYGSVGVNFSNIKISRNGVCLLNVPLSEGAGDKVTDVCNSSQYQLSFFTTSIGWAKLSAYFHWNFRYGFTLYTKSASPNLYIPNTSLQTEISVTPPSGYSRIANYKSCQKLFNKCESKFKLDDVDESSDLRNADVDEILFDSVGSAKEISMGSMYSEIVNLVHDRGHLYINEDSDANFMLYKTDKGVDTPADLKIWKYVEKE